jgi:8-oxo-dGTP pyrophosphatase MutT (NUDIX family)
MGDIAPQLKFQDTVRRALAERTVLTNKDPSLSPAAVLLVFYMKDGQHCILFNKRSETVEHHKGEISFPGGARDPEDRDFRDTALRETSEEMGIDRADVTVLGELDDIATRSRFGVRVYVGTIPYPYPFEPSSVEIAEVLEVPVRGLLDPDNRRQEVRWMNGKTAKQYCYAFEDHLIFGATAQIVKQFLDLFPRDTVKEGVAN